MTLAAKIDQVNAKVSECVALANKTYNITLPDINIRFDLKGRAAGWASRRRGQYSIRFNINMMQDDGWAHVLNNTVPHELAHIVCYYKPTLGRQHDYGWKRVCIALGGNGQRCHKEEVVYANGLTFAYKTKSGLVVRISETRHRRVQAGTKYNFRNHGKIDNTCSFELIQPSYASVRPAMPVIAPSAAMPTTPRIAGASNADQVRRYIAEAKQNGYSADTVVALAVAALGMTPQLAKIYVKNNWNKV